MSTFAERKAARAAAGQKKYEFNVVACWPFEGEVLATFKSKNEAGEFAHKQIGLTVGNTRARHALFSRHSNTHISSGQQFKVERAEIA